MCNGVAKTLLFIWKLNDPEFVNNFSGITFTTFFYFLIYEANTPTCWIPLEM